MKKNTVLLKNKKIITNTSQSLDRTLKQLRKQNFNDKLVK